jgi:hypothetical protein
LDDLKKRFGKGYRLTISHPIILREDRKMLPIVVTDLIEDEKLEVINEF